MATGIVSYVLMDGEILEAEGSSALSVALVIATAVFVNLSLATTVGAAIPVIMRRMGLDPALASSIVLTFFTDVVGFGGFLLVATLLL